VTFARSDPVRDNGDHRNGYTVGLARIMFARVVGLAEYQIKLRKSQFTTPVALVPFGSFNPDDHV